MEFVFAFYLSCVFYATEFYHNHNKLFPITIHNVIKYCCTFINDSTCLRKNYTYRAQYILEGKSVYMVFINIFNHHKKCLTLSCITCRMNFKVKQVNHCPMLPFFPQYVFLILNMYWNLFLFKTVFLTNIVVTIYYTWSMVTYTLKPADMCSEACLYLHGGMKTSLRSHS